MTTLDDAIGRLRSWLDSTLGDVPIYPADVRALIAEYERLAAPLTDAEREALIRTLDDAADRWATLIGNHAHRTRNARDDCMAGQCDGDITPNGYGFTRHTPSRVEYIADAILAAGSRRQGPITDAQALRAEEERESHRYSPIPASDPFQVRCTCGWVGPYAREWRLHRERAALEAARDASSTPEPPVGASHEARATGELEALADILDEVHDEYPTEGGCGFRAWHRGWGVEPATPSQAAEEILEKLRAAGFHYQGPATEGGTA